VGGGRRTSQQHGPAEYKHVVLGLIFLKYISDAFEAKHAELDAQKAEGADPEDPDEYRAASIFWVPKEARWSHLKANAPQPTIGRLVDDAMAAIERDNQSLKGVLPKDYARPGLDKQRLGQLINLVSDIGLGTPADRAKDVLGRSTSTSWPSSRAPKARRAGNSTRPPTWCGCWSRCSHPSRVASMTPAAGRAGCSCRARSY
jgi:type I restriction-modification system DNA methylase subunit